MTAAADVVTSLASCRKAVQLYPPSHPAYGEALSSLVAAVNDVTVGGSFVLNLYEGHLYHESVALPPEAHGADSIAEAFEDRRIESLTIGQGFSPEHALGLTEVLCLRPDAQMDVSQELMDRGVHSVMISELADDDAEERAERDRQREADRAMYNRVISALRTLRAQFSAGGAGDLSQTTGLVAGVIERLAADPSAVLGLAMLRSAGDHALFHSLNVTIYALSMGQEMELSEEDLSTLGLSALLHDSGKAAFDEADPNQIEPMRTMHPRVGAEILQRLALENPAPMLVAYEHHMSADGGGWPEREADREIHPFSRIVAVADRYANLTDPDAGTDLLTPDKAIAQILREAGTTLDPFFARLLANALGAFPVGCLVRLSDHSVAVVSKQGDDLLVPIVRVIFDDMGAEIEESKDLNLAESGLTILEVIDPEVLRLEVADKL